MPRVTKRTKSTRGRARTCGNCGVEIRPGQPYLQWSFRYGGTHYRCVAHPPRPSELTQSKLSEVYAAVENAEDSMPGAASVAEVLALVESVAEQVRTTAEEYREAAEAFGGEGENAERADELEGWADELDGFDPEEDGDEDEDDRRFRIESEEACRLLKDLGHAYEPEDWRGMEPFARADVLERAEVDLDELQRATDERDAEESGAVEAAREAAQDLLGGCPL